MLLLKLSGGHRVNSVSVLNLLLYSFSMSTENWTFLSGWICQSHAWGKRCASGWTYSRKLFNNCDSEVAWSSMGRSNKINKKGDSTKLAPYVLTLFWLSGLMQKLSKWHSLLVLLIFSYEGSLLAAFPVTEKGPHCLHSWVCLSMQHWGEGMERDLSQLPHWESFTYKVKGLTFPRTAITEAANFLNLLLPTGSKDPFLLLLPFSQL